MVQYLHFDLGRGGNLMRFALEMDDGITLATWDAPASEPNFSFPKEFWKVGIMVLNGHAIIVKEGVSLCINERRQWRRQVPRGSAKLLEELSSPSKKKRCCHGHD